MSEATPTQIELRERIDWFIRLRWLAAVGAGLVIFVAQQLGYALPYAPLYGVAALILVINVGWAIIVRRARLEDGTLPPRLAPIIANAQSALDLLCLTLLLHFAGATENPFLFFYIFHMIIASVLLSVRSAYGQATVGSALFWGLVLLERFGVVPHHHLGIHAFAAEHRGAFPLAVAGALTATLFLAVYLTTSITRRLRQREEEVARLLADLQARTQELEAANQACDNAQRAQALYLRKVAHELKAPLAATQSALKAVLHMVRPDLPERHARMLTHAEMRLDGLLDLVRKLLVLAHTTEAALLGRREPVNLAQVIQESVGLLQARAEEKQIALELQMADGLPSVLAEPEGIEAMVANLLSNGIRYTLPGGRVWVRAARRNGGIVLEVQDTGIGIAPEDRPRVFEEFFRSRTAREFSDSGTGLGLAIVKNVVESAGGTVEFDSEVNEGTTFRVFLPAAP
jgi:signal transduction histidine kinase